MVESNLDNIQKTIEFYNELKQLILMIKNNRILSKYLENNQDYIKLIKYCNSRFIGIENLEELKNSYYIVSNEVNQVLLNYESNYLFPGDYLVVYSIVSELRAHKKHIYSFSGNIINIDSNYYSCKLLIENLSKKSVYISDKIVSYSDYMYLFPSTLTELEEFLFRIDHAYENCDDEYYNISCNLKNHNLELRKLR